MTYHGPFDAEAWPERLQANVVEPTEPPRIHGYDVCADLARHYDVIDVAWLALRGELPTAIEREVVNVALVWLAPLHVGDAAVHATVLARVAGAPPRTVPQIAAVGLTELAHDELARLAPLRAWLDEPVGSVPSVALASSPTAASAAAQAELASASVHWFGADKALPAAPVLDRAAVGYALLHRLGLDELGASTLATWARLPVAVAEAMRVRPGDVRGYPARLPDYEYVEDGERP